MGKPKTKRARREPLLKRWRFNCADASKVLTLHSDGTLDVSPPSKLLPLGDHELPEFDELVVHNAGIHIESMSATSLSIWLGSAMFVLWRDRAGKLHLRLQEGVYEPSDGLIHEHGWTPKKGSRR